MLRTFFNHYFLMWSLPNILQKLPEHQTNAMTRDKSGRTALHYAAENGHAEIVELLLKVTPDVNARDRYGDTALQHCMAIPKLSNYC